MEHLVKSRSVIFNRNMTDKQLRQFFFNVMIRLGYHDWTLLLEDIKAEHSYCYETRKCIVVGTQYSEFREVSGNGIISIVGDVRHILLHEIAHIGIGRFCWQTHSRDFWKRYEYLLHKFLKQSLKDLGYLQSVCYRYERDRGVCYRKEYDHWIVG